MKRKSTFMNIHKFKVTPTVASSILTCAHTRSRQILYYFRIVQIFYSAESFHVPLSRRREIFLLSSATFHSRFLFHIFSREQRPRLFSMWYRNPDEGYKLKNFSQTVKQNLIVRNTYKDYSTKVQYVSWYYINNILHNNHSYRWWKLRLHYHTDL